jgi:hypothetical protein
MAEKDTTEKLLEAHNDVFSDTMNVYLYGGKRLIKEDELEVASVTTGYVFEDALRAQVRNVCKHWKKENVQLALLGIENQSDIDRDMPLRIIGYDGAAFRGQLKVDKNQDGSFHRNHRSRYPVVSVVIYYGQNRWNRPLKLKDVLQVPEGLENFDSDYKINVMDLRRLRRETVDQFQSDFWFVADYFWQVEHTRDYKPSLNVISHIEEVLNLFRYALRDDCFRIENIVDEGEEVPRNMCEVLDKVENRGIEKGKIEGNAQTLVRLVENFVRYSSCSVEVACKMLGCSVQEYYDAKDMIANISGK